MKKVLAILLSLAMLLPGMSVLMSAKQVIQEVKEVNLYGEANETNHNVTFYINKQIQMDIRLKERSGVNSGLVHRDEFYEATTIGFTTDGVSVNNEKIAKSFEYGVWYTVKWDGTNGSNIVITVNGEEIGTVNKTFASNNVVNFYGCYYDIDNIKALNGENGPAATEDFESYDAGKTFSVCGDFKTAGTNGWGGPNGNIAVRSEEKVLEVKNENVYEAETDNKVLSHPEAGVFGTEKDAGIASQDEYTVKFRARFDKETDADTYSFGKTHFIINVDGTVGTNSATKKRAEPFTVGKWYEFTYYTDGSDTTILVDGQPFDGAEGKIGAGMKNETWYGGIENISLDDIRVYNGNAITNAALETYWAEDFQDGVFDKAHADGIAGKVVNSVEEVKRDLGKKYMDCGSSKYMRTTFDKVFSFDFCLTDDNSALYDAGNDGSALVSLSSVGVMLNGGAKHQKEMTLTKGVWYFYECRVENGKTTVYLDGTKIIEVDSEYAANSGEPQRTIGMSAKNVLLDNFRGTQPSWGAELVEDFEDGEWNLRDRENTLHDGGGSITTREYELKKVDLLDLIETQEPGGDAVLLQQAPSSSTKAHSVIVPADGNFATGGELESYVLNFDLALIPNLTSENEGEGNYFEIRTVESNSEGEHGKQRFNNWRIGVKPTLEADGTVLKGYVGQHQCYDWKSGDKTIYEDKFVKGETFEWGDLSASNFHNVTVVANFKSGKMMIYIDKDKVAEGEKAEPILTTSIGQKGADTVLFGLYNSNAIIDNMQIFNIDGKALSTGVEFPASSAGNGQFDGRYEEVAFTSKQITLDIAEDSTFCATNGHVSGTATRPEARTCHKTVNDVAHCALCDATDENATFTRELPVIPHKWDKINMRSKGQDEDGKDVIIFACTREGEGCTERYYTTYPAEGTYTGTLHEYYDMSNELVLLAENGLNTEAFKIENGLLKFGKGTGNAANKSNEISYVGYDPCNDVRTNNWTWSMDIVYNGIYDTKDVPSYGHILAFNTDATLQKGLVVGYNADEHKVYIQTKTGNPTSPFVNEMGEAVTADFTMIEGNKYNVSVSSYFDPEDPFSEDSYLALSINGVELVKVDSECPYAERIFDHIEEGKYTNTLDSLVIRDFGVSYDMVDLALGTADFAYTDRTYVGDVDGDNHLEAADALLMRQYLATIKDASDIQLSRADVNGDGRVNAKDQLCIRLALAEQAAAN